MTELELDLEAAPEPRAPTYIGNIRVGGVNGVWLALDHVLASVTIRHGRDSVDGGIESSTCTLALRAIPRSNLSIYTVGTTLEVWDNTNAKLFTGTVTDLALAEDDPRTDAVITVIASSTLATAGLKQVRGHQWPAEGWGSRARRIMSEAGMGAIVQAPTPDVPLAATKPDDPESGSYSATDALSALNEILNDVEGTAFERGDGVIVIQAYAARAGLYPLLTIPPELVLYSPDWAQTLDVKNRIVLGWGYGGGSVTVDEPDSQRVYGLRWTGLFDSGLADAATANARALDWLDRNAWPRWSLSAVTLLEPLSLQIGQLVQLSELPSSAPFVAWNAVLEGWTDTFEGPDWTQVLCLSDPIESGLALPWQDVPPDLVWSGVDPACRWTDAFNIGNLVPEA